jgi:uncharacterized membrane protein
MRRVPMAVMPVALVLIACGFWRNPTLVGADKLLESEDPARGIIRITRHPIMWGFMLWALAHVAARGDLKAMIFFGGFFILASLGTAAMDKRKARTGGENWQRFARATSNIPFVAVASGRNRIVWREIGWLRPLIGLAAFGALLWLHPLLFGTRPY